MSQEGLSPAEEVALARKALAERQLAHAAHHLGAALLGDPHHPDWLALLDEVLDAADDPLQLCPIPSDEPLWLGDGVVRVRALGRLGRRTEALALMLQLSVVRPEVPLLGWAKEWLDDKTVRVDASDYAGFLGGWARRFGGTVIPEGAIRRQLGQALPVAARALADFPDDPQILVLAAALSRKAGLAEGPALARRAFAVQPGWNTAVSMAMAHRADGDLDGAIAWYERALEFDPEDLSARLDLGDLQCEAERWQAGLARYAEVLAVVPDHPWALPSHAYYRVLSGDEGGRLPLEAFARLHPDNTHARRLVDEMTPYCGWLPQLGDSLVQLTAELDDRLTKEPPREGAIITVEVSFAEAASAWLSAVRLCASHGAKLLIETREIQHPDPRQPARETTLKLYDFLGDEPRPLPEPPDPETLATLDAISESRFDATKWSQLAAALAAALGPGCRQHLLGAMVSPSSPPPNCPPWAWLRRTQIAAALVLGHLPGGRADLVDLLFGPTDWSVDAAIVALAQLAVEDPAFSPEVDELFFERMGTLPKEGYCCWQLPLWCAWLRLPSLSEDSRIALEKNRAEWLES